MPVGSTTKNYAREEARLLGSLAQHPYVIHYIASFIEDSTSAEAPCEAYAMHIVMDLAIGGTLWDRICTMYTDDHHSDAACMMTTTIDGKKTSETQDNGANPALEATHGAHVGQIRRLKALRANRAGVCKFGEDVMWRWAGQMALGLEFLHANAIVHRDFKSSNVFLNERDEAVIG
jgi:serine/threonine protein kinase